MRTHQTSQSAALAVGLVAALGFLGYTMLGPRLMETSRQSQLPLRASTTEVAKPPEPRSAMPPTTAAPLTPEVVASGFPPTPDAAVLQAAHAQVTALPVVRATVAPVIVIEPPPPVELPAPITPPPLPVPVVSVRPAPVAKPAPRPTVPRSKQVASSREVRAVPAQAAPVESLVTPRAKSLATSREVRTVHVQAEEPPVAVSSDTHIRKPARGSASAPFSKEEMTVTISGDKAWVQISPTQTLTVRKGDALPNLGKILEIKDKEVVAEKGTLTTN